MKVRRAHVQLALSRSLRPNFDLDFANLQPQKVSFMKLEFYSRVSLRFIDESSKLSWVTDNVHEKNGGHQIKLLCPISRLPAGSDVTDFSDDYDDGLLIFEINTIGYTPRRWFEMLTKSTPTLKSGRLDFCCHDIYISGEELWDAENETLTADFRIGEELNSSDYYDYYFTRCSACKRMICVCDNEFAIA